MARNDHPLGGEDPTPRGWHAIPPPTERQDALRATVGAFLAADEALRIALAAAAHPHLPVPEGSGISPERAAERLAEARLAFEQEAQIWYDAHGRRPLWISDYTTAATCLVYFDVRIQAGNARVERRDVTRLS